MSLAPCLRALGQAHTYDLRRNASLRAGLLLGLFVSVLPLACEGILSGIGTGDPFRGLRSSPLSLVLLAHPVLFGLMFGAVGTVRRNLDRLHERDVTTLSGLAMTDPLTGLYNRRYVEEELKNLLHRARRTGGQVSVVFFDLDHFKEVNRTRGHRGGDEMLRKTAFALQTTLRQGETLGRYGGDEFLLVVAADLPYAEKCAERAVAAVKASTRLSMSRGIARFRDDGTTPAGLIAAADARLTKAKEKQHRSPAFRASEPLKPSLDVRMPRSTLRAGATPETRWPGAGGEKAGRTGLRVGEPERKAGSSAT